MKTIGRLSLSIISVVTLTLLAGCSTVQVKESLDGAKDLYLGPGNEKPTWGINSEIHQDLISLPQPKGKIYVSIYGFRDLSGQYKSSPSNGISTAVSQGAGAILVKAVKDSNWFIPIEREGLQNLLTERKIIRAGLRNGGGDIPPLLGASLLLEGGIIGYDSNIKTGGAGARYFGIGTSEQYRVDQVTVSLRAVDIYTGKIINTVVVTKSIFSLETNAGVYRFVKFKRLLELEAGFTQNEPVQLALVDAIEAAVIRLIVNGIEDNLWTVARPTDLQHPLIQFYSDRNMMQERERMAAITTNESEPAATKPEPKAAKSSPSKKANTTPPTPPPPSANITKMATEKPASKAQQPAASDAKRNQPSKPAPPPKPDPTPKPQEDTHNQEARKTAPSDPDLSPDLVLNDQTQMPLKYMYSVSPSIKSKGRFYSVQLMSSDNANDLIDFLSNTQAQRDDLIYISYELAGHEMFAVLYGSFLDKQQAESFLQELPPELKSHEPWIREVEKPNEQ